MDPVKLEGISKWPTPKTVKDVRSFIGFGNFYRRFIDHFSDLSQPLVELTRKDTAWEWTPARQKAFETLKKRFTERPVLLTPDKTKRFCMETDASKYATGAVLKQKDGNGDWHPVGYLSQSFNSAQRNYEVYDRELLLIIRALESWRHYLEGSPHQLVIYSDHKNLQYFKKAQNLNRRQARWMLYIS